MFLAFAAASMFKALNGLSGLELVSKKELIWIQLVVAVAFLIRRGAEDVATYLYPSRSAQVQPEKLTSPGVGMSWISVAVRVIVFVMIAVPFFGFGWVTLAAALLTAIPMALKIYAAQLAVAEQVVPAWSISVCPPARARCLHQHVAAWPPCLRCADSSDLQPPASAGHRCRTDRIDRSAGLGMA